MHTDPLRYRLFQERPALAIALAGLSAPAPAEARALVTTPEPGADPLERLDPIETNLLHKFPQLTREEIRAIQPFFTLVVPTVIFGTLARMPTEDVGHNAAQSERYAAQCNVR